AVGNWRLELKLACPFEIKGVDVRKHLLRNWRHEIKRLAVHLLTLLARRGALVSSSLQIYNVPLPILYPQPPHGCLRFVPASLWSILCKRGVIATHGLSSLSSRVLSSRRFESTKLLSCFSTITRFEVSTGSTSGL